MKTKPDQTLIASLLKILAKYDTNEINEAISFIQDPQRISALSELFSAASSKAPSSPRKKPQKPKISIEKLTDNPEKQQIAKIIFASVENNPWSKLSPFFQVITSQYNTRPINGKSRELRQNQLIQLINQTPTSTLQEIAEKIDYQTRSGGSLAEWSDIILGKTKN